MGAEMSARHSPFARLRYWFDNYLAWSGLARLLLIVLLGIGALVMGAVLVKVLAPNADPSASFLEALWWSWGRVADPGSGAGDTGTGVRAAEIITTFGGMILFAFMIGFVSSSVEDKLGQLRKGTSLVVEQDHTVVLGFGQKTLKIIEELAVANESRKDAAVVILSAQEKETVMDTILERFGGATVKTSRIVVRHGASDSPAALENVSVSHARSVIVLTDEAEGAANRDVRVIKTILALSRGLKEPLAGHIVAEFSDADHGEVAHAIARDKVKVVVAQSFLARLVVQTARQTGLAQVYADLLSFDGAEFYLTPPPPALVGKTFRDAWSSIREGVVCGLASRSPKAGQRFGIQVCPPEDTVITADDRLVVLMEDDSVQLSVAPIPTNAALPARSREKVAPAPERILILGYQDDLGDMLLEFDNYVAPGSEALVVTSLDAAECERRLKDDVAGLGKLSVRFATADTTLRRELEPLCTGGFDAAIVVADHAEDRSPEDTDARTLMTLLLLRDLSKKQKGLAGTRLISEIRNPQTKGLASIAQIGDFVVSEELVSSFLAQVAEAPELADLWTDLCDADGHEIYLKPAWRFITPGESPSFADLMARARAREEVALGYKVKALEDDAAQNYGIVLNPPDKLAPLRLEPEDRIIVIAMDET